MILAREHALETFGQRIKALRKLRKIPVKVLCNQAKISDSSLFSYEDNHTKPTWETVARLADALDVDVRYLMFGRIT